MGHRTWQGATVIGLRCASRCFPFSRRHCGSLVRGPPPARIVVGLAACPVLVAACLAADLARDGRVGAVPAEAGCPAFLPCLSGQEPRRLLPFGILASGPVALAPGRGSLRFGPCGNPGFSDPWLCGLRFPGFWTFCPLGSGFLLGQDKFGTKSSFFC